MFDYKEFLQINPPALGPVKGKCVSLWFGHYWLGTKPRHYDGKSLVLRILILHFYFEAGLVNVVHKKHLMVFCMISRDPAVVVFSSLYINI